MQSFLERYIDGWNFIFRPLVLLYAWTRRIQDKVRIWLIGDLIKVLIAIPVFMLAGLYVSIPSILAPPVSGIALGAIVGAGILRHTARLAAAEGKPIRSGFFGELAAASGWSSVGLLALTGAQIWLNMNVASADPHLVSAFEARLLDATAGLRSVLSWTNVAIAFGALAVLALIVRSARPVLAAASVRRGLSALVAVGATASSFTFVAAESTRERHDLIADALINDTRSSVQAAWRDQKASAAMNFTAAELQRRPVQQRQIALNQVALAVNAAQDFCVQHLIAFDDAVKAQGLDLSVPSNPTAATDARRHFCDGDAVLGDALSAMARVGGDPTDVIAVDRLAGRDILRGASTPLQDAVFGAGGLGPVSIVEARRARIVASEAASEAAKARGVIRGILVEGVTGLLGNQFGGVVGKVVDALAGAVGDRLAQGVETRALQALAQAEPTRLTTEEPAPIRAEEPLPPQRARVLADAEFVSLSQAYDLPTTGAAMATDDVLQKCWRARLAAAGAPIGAVEAMAAFAAAKAAGNAAAMRAAIHGAKGPKRIPRVRF
jgi:hypothetical protein